MHRFLFLAAAPLIACGDDAAPTTSSPSRAAAGGSSASGGASSSGSGSGSGSGGQSSSGSGSGGASLDPCTADGLSVGEQQMEIMFDGGTRAFEVQVPASYDGVTRVPMVFDLHGYTQNKDQQQAISGIAAKAESEGFVVVRPNGSGVLPSWNGGDACCGTAQSQDRDDVGLMKAIASEVSSLGCIDERRIYATGISNGGALAHRLACEAADVFAAVAPVSYPLDRDPLSKCQPSRPVAVMHFHGINDTTVPYGGRIFPHVPASQDSFDYWAQANGCSGTPSTSYDKGSSACETYDNCSDGVEVTLCSIDGGHLLYSNADDVPIATLAWEFLSRFSLP